MYGSVDSGGVMKLWLRMMIIKKFGTQRNFAKACGRSDCWISTIIVERREPTEEEKRLITEKLELDREDKLFL